VSKKKRQQGNPIMQKVVTEMEKLIKRAMKTKPRMALAYHLQFLSSF